MYLFFDVETDGLPKDYKAKLEDVDNWPLVVQLAWALYDENEYLVKSKSSLIWQKESLPEEVTKIHGITDDMLKKYGTPIGSVLPDFKWDCTLSKYLIAHNIDFDKKVVGAEFAREGQQKLNYDDYKLICTMESSTEYCELPGNYGFKWPKLEELYFKLFNKKIEGSHNAMIDVFATAKCFFKLKELKIIKMLAE